MERLGPTVEEAWETVKTAVNQVADAAWVGDLEAIDEVDLTPMFKWKLAFLYQARERATIFPIFATNPLVALYQRYVDPAARTSARRGACSTRRSATVLQIEDPIQVGHHLWDMQKAQEAERRAWVLDLGHAVDEEAEGRRSAARLASNRGGAATAPRVVRPRGTGEPGGPARGGGRRRRPQPRDAGRGRRRTGRVGPRRPATSAGRAGRCRRGSCGSPNGWSARSFGSPTGSPRTRSPSRRSRPRSPGTSSSTARPAPGRRTPRRGARSG